MSKQKPQAGSLEELLTDPHYQEAAKITNTIPDDVDAFLVLALTGKIMRALKTAEKFGAENALRQRDEAHAAVVAQARRSGLEDAAREVCWGCRTAKPTYHNHTKTWRHDAAYGGRCQAGAIYNLIAREEAANEPA